MKASQRTPFLEDRTRLFDKLSVSMLEKDLRSAASAVVILVSRSVGARLRQRRIQNHQKSKPRGRMPTGFQLSMQAIAIDGGLGCAEASSATRLDIGPISEMLRAGDSVSSSSRRRQYQSKGRLRALFSLEKVAQLNDGEWLKALDGCQ